MLAGIGFSPVDEVAILEPGVAQAGRPSNALLLQPHVSLACIALPGVLAADPGKVPADGC